jgi:hypothetical protein
MKQEHLSSWQIEELIIAGPGQHDGTELGRAEAHETSTPATRHLEACELCKASAERLQEFIHLYRESALIQTSAAETKAFAHSPAAPQPFWTMWRVATWGLALILLLAVFVPIFLQQQRGGRHQQQHSSKAAQIATDNLLLQKVDEEVSYSVPQPLESLTDPATDGSSSNQ